MLPEILAGDASVRFAAINSLRSPPAAKRAFVADATDEIDIQAM
jgi:hypothetical protein